MNKITLATFKSFVKKNRDKLYVKVSREFDGMVDGIENVKNSAFRPVREDQYQSPEHTLGIMGVWLVGGSRNYFSQYKDDNFIGIEVDNSCGSFIVAIQQTIN